MIDVIFTKTSFYIDQIDDVKLHVDLDTEAFLNAFEKNRYEAIYNMSFKPCPTFFGVGLKYLHMISEYFVQELLKQPSLEFERGSMEFSLSDEIIESLEIKVPYCSGSEYIQKEWIQMYIQSLLDVYNLETKNFEGGLESYFNQKNNDLEMSDKVYFHLVETHEEIYPFAFVATYSAPKVEGRKTYHMPLENAFKEYQGDTKKLLELLGTVIKVSKKSEFMKGLIENGEIFHAIRLTSKDATTFLYEVPLYESYGIVCRIPNWWRKKSAVPKSSFAIDENLGEKLNLQSIVKFKPTVVVNGVELSKEDLYELLKEDEGLILFNGQWVDIKKEHIEELLEILEENPDGIPYSIQDLIQEQFVKDEQVDDLDDVAYQVFMNLFKKQLTKRTRNLEIKPPQTLKATLRPYQKDGYQWLYAMSELGLGQLLADDMGLGKTIQVLALLDACIENDKKPNLLVVPSSLISNWQSEIEKFLPNLTYKILHNSASGFDRHDFMDAETSLYITTYTMVKKIEELTNVHWYLLILDEAQAIKNPLTKQTKSIKALKSDVRLALTGTPVENNPGDVWSLFDFLNPGLLGNRSQFKKYVTSLNKDPNKIVELRNTIQPFMLRRLKTDRTIIKDLPDKIEIKDYVELSPKQSALYMKVVDELQEKLESEDGIERRGLVLATISSLKQICNHPSQYLKDEKYKPSDSGKFTYMNEILTTIKEKRERVLVFTQFAEIIPYMDAYLEGIFGRKGFVISGKTPVKKRGEIVKVFNNEDQYIPYVILSLKAGGTGLNLTAANHVLHFDRWWNPAVENQATDRAYRIGQKNDVIVRKLITKGTLEETIDQKIDSKIQLAEDLLTTDGLAKTIMDMSNQELIEFISLKKGV